MAPIKELGISISDDGRFYCEAPRDAECVAGCLRRSVKGLPVANPSHPTGCSAMGQQQMLLLLVASMIVGVAIVAGLDQHVESARRANHDQVRDGLFEMAARAQGWYRRPVALGGGGRSFAEIDWVRLNVDSATTAGHYVMSHQSQDSFRVKAFSVEDPTWSLTLTVYADDFALAP